MKKVLFILTTVVFGLSLFSFCKVDAYASACATPIHFFELTAEEWEMVPRCAVEDCNAYIYYVGGAYCGRHTCDISTCLAYTEDPTMNYTCCPKHRSGDPLIDKINWTSEDLTYSIDLFKKRHHGTCHYGGCMKKYSTGRTASAAYTDNDDSETYDNDGGVCDNAYTGDPDDYDFDTYISDWDGVENFVDEADAADDFEDNEAWIDY